MSWTERQRCHFESYPDGEGRPSHLYIDLAENQSSLLSKKQIGRLFFSLRKDVTWDAVTALVDELNTKIEMFCVNHSADEEES